MKQNFNQPPHFTDLIRAPEIEINLARGGNKWEDVIRADGEIANDLFKNALRKFPVLARLTSCAFGGAFRRVHGAYLQELEVWAKALERPFGQVAMVNCAYEYDHLGDILRSFMVGMKALWRNIFGCTSVVLTLAENETVQVRNLDWPIPGMGPATRVFRFVGDRHEFKIVGFPGYVGALSGMVPGEYSVTINWAPPQRMPSFEHAPAFLLRNTLQTKRNFYEACEHLEKCALSTSVFYTICGVETGCVIERTPAGYARRNLEDGFIVQTNHHIAAQFESNNRMLKELSSDPLVHSTVLRFNSIIESIQTSGIIGSPFEPERLVAIMNTGVVTNAQTMQRMILRPRTGAIYLQTACAS